MSYLDESRLSTYDSNLKEWISSQESKTITSSIYPWTKTAKAGAVSCYPVGGTELKPVVDFLFTETPPASGDKGPENPSTITGVSSVNVTRCGQNLLPRDPVSSMMSQRGITVTYNEDGSIHLKGTATAGYDAYMSYFNNATLGVVPSVMAAGRTITVSVVCNDSNVSGKIYDSNSLTVWGNPVNVSPGTPVTHTMQSSVKSAMFRIMVTRGSTVDCDVHCQIEYGDTATSWEAPADTTYPLSLGSTYYGGTLDVASGVMTVTHSGMTLNGDTYLSTGIFDEQSDVYGVGFYPDPERLMTLSDSSDAACSILPVAVGTGAKNYPCAYLVNNAMGIRLQFSKTSLGLGDGVEASEVRTAVKAFLAQHPGFIVWPVASPAAVQLTPTEILSLTQTDKYTPRINTVYTDASAVQVGYVKSPIRDEYELQQAIVAQGGEI